jgi:hypothetical protein
MLSISLIKIEFSLLLKLLSFSKIAGFLKASIYVEMMLSAVWFARSLFIMWLFEWRFLPVLVLDIFRDVSEVDWTYFDLLGTEGSGKDLLLSSLLISLVRMFLRFLSILPLLGYVFFS